MKRRIPFHSIMFAMLFIGLFLLNTHFFQSPMFGVLLLVAYLSIFGYELGSLVHQETGVVRWWLGCWLLLSLISLVLAMCYYVAFLSQTIVEAVILLSIPVILFLSERKGRPHWYEHIHAAWKSHKHEVTQPVWLAASLIGLLLVYVFSVYGSTPILDAVRSPWERVNGSVVIAAGFIFLLLMTLLYRARERALALPLFCLTLFATISMAAFVFPIGFGFDSFIHKATESYIAEFATITPKPFYYIGQYALVLFANLGFSIPIDLADTFLLPILTALLLPIAWFGAATHLLKNHRSSITTLIGIFLLPLSIFIVTTPQGLAHLWTLLLILASIPYLLKQEHPRLVLLSIAALTTLFIHPISGIPALFYCALLFTDPSQSSHRHETLARWAFRFLSLAACLVLPLSFIANAFISKQALSIDWGALNPLSVLKAININVLLENRFNPLLDFVYLYGLNTVVIFLVFVVIGCVAERQRIHRLNVPIIMAVALAINFLLMKSSINFLFLIDYERQNYTDRLIPLFLFFLVPLFILGLSTMITSIRKRPIVLRLSWILLMSALTTSSFYLTYPRKDAYVSNRGFNVSQADIYAVRLVEELARTDPYLVLANQSVSAAAIQEIGFRYYDNVFFYPIPTGGLLYQRFLEMNDRPSRDIASDALELTSTHSKITTLFYVVNTYWWESARIIETTKTIADDWRSLENGAVYVFRFDVK